MKMGSIPRRCMAAACLLAALMLLIPAPACKPKDVQTTTGGRILISDNVELDEGDRQAVFNMEPPLGSLNEYGYYLSTRFFLASGDTIQVIITGDAPITLTGGVQSEAGGLQTGLNSIGEEDEPTTNIDLSYFSLVTTASANNMWETIYTFPSKRVPESYYRIPPGYYQLNIFNDSGREAQCSYTITLLAG